MAAPIQQKYSEEDTAKHLKAIIETAVDGIITITEEGIIETINPAAAMLFGYKKEEVIGQNVRILLPSPFREMEDRYMGAFLESGKKTILGGGKELRGRRKGGSHFPFRLSFSEVQFKDRKIYTGILHDLTEQVLAEQKMWQEKERAQQYLEIANTIMVALDKAGRIVLFNRKGEEVLGYSEGEVLGQNWFDLFAPDAVRAQVKESYQRAMDGKIIAERYFENTLITKKGKALNIAWHNSLIYDAENQIAGALSSGTDVTQQKETELEIIKLNVELESRVRERTEELNDTINRLFDEIQERKNAEILLRQREEDLKIALNQEKQLNELKSRFVSMASHEFRTPLSTILSSAALLERYTTTEQQVRRDKHVKKIKTSVQNLNGILNDFLSLSKLEEGKVKLKHENFDFNELCLEIIDELEGLLKLDQKIDFQSLPIKTQIPLDRRILKNCLINLLSNAIKYSPESSTIFLKAILEKNQLSIAVKDQGIGIPEADKPFMFSRFFRATNVENIKGTGLGLTIVQRYLKLMNGEINFESEVGKGTTFLIKIPMNYSE